jgi:transposase-like protein
MIEVFDTAAARVALTRRALACPGCGSPLRPWGRARERTVRDLGAPVTLRPDRAMCIACRRSHVVLDAGLLARRGYTARFVGVALVGAARGQGHRTVAAELGAPEATVRGWIRRASRSAGLLRATGIRAVVALDQDALPTRVQPTELGYALSALGAAAALYARRPALAGVGPWALINVLTRGQLLRPAAPA